MTDDRFIAPSINPEHYRGLVNDLRKRQGYELVETRLGVRVACDQCRSLLTVWTIWRQPAGKERRFIVCMNCGRAAEEHERQPAEGAERLRRPLTASGRYDVGKDDHGQEG
jgi:hypothetical protein